MIPIVNYPKLHSPFVREKINGKYQVIDQIAEGLEWLTDKGVIAVDKLHGTNVCVNLAAGLIESIDNRTQRVFQSCFVKTDGIAPKMLIGVMNAANRGWLPKDGKVYGELLGPDINGNIHKADNYLFVPFDYLKSKCHWHSWVQDKYPKTFDAISEWFKNLESLFSDRIFGQKVLAEGLVFYHPDGRRCKLRRDMFDWYTGEGHKECQNA